MIDGITRGKVVMLCYFYSDDGVCFSVSSKFELAVSSLGACVWCLKRAHTDYSILSLASFHVSLL